MQPLLVVIALDELRDVIPRVLQVLVLIRIDFFSFSVLMKVSQLALSYGFAGRLMLGTMPCFFRIATYSAEAY
jgi:hypothetical protein